MAVPRDSDISSAISALQPSVEEANFGRESVMKVLSDVKDALRTVKTVLAERLGTQEERLGRLAQGIPAQVRSMDGPRSSLPRDADPRQASFLSEADEKIIRHISKRGRCFLPILQ